MEATISILRGLTDKYEAHYGVRISDAALITAAKLSDRYITNRFLPDKAIDLMDEAADVLERKIPQLQTESTALGREKDKSRKERK